MSSTLSPTARASAPADSLTCACSSDNAVTRAPGAWMTGMPYSAVSSLRPTLSTARERRRLITVATQYRAGSHGRRAGLRGQVVGAGAPARAHRAVESGPGQPGLLVPDLQGRLPDQGGPDLA